VAVDLMAQLDRFIVKAYRPGETVVKSWSCQLLVRLCWIAEVSELNALLYGDSQQDAIQHTRSAAREMALDRIAHGELPPDSADALSDAAA
jgi:hypothetical protein